MMTGGRAARGKPLGRNEGLFSYLKYEFVSQVVLDDDGTCYPCCGRSFYVAPHAGAESRVTVHPCHLELGSTPFLVHLAMARQRALDLSLSLYSETGEECYKLKDAKWPVIWTPTLVHVFTRRADKCCIIENPEPAWMCRTLPDRESAALFCQRYPYRWQHTGEPLPTERETVTAISKLQAKRTPDLESVMRRAGVVSGNESYSAVATTSNRFAPLADSMEAEVHAVSLYGPQWMMNMIIRWIAG